MVIKIYWCYFVWLKRVSWLWHIKILISAAHIKQKKKQYTQFFQSEWKKTFIKLCLVRWKMHPKYLSWKKGNIPFKKLMKGNTLLILSINVFSCCFELNFCVHKSCGKVFRWAAVVLVNVGTCCNICFFFSFSLLIFFSKSTESIIVKGGWLI